MIGFGARLHAAMASRGPLCAGIDPHPALLAAWGLSSDVDGLERFSRTVVDALAGQVAVLKPQSAFFECYGSRGIAVLERVIADARSAGALVIADVKRGDIGSTAAAYAQAYLDPSSPLFCDAMTASPYLGVGALAPLVDTALANGAGVFVLALTSNVEGRTVQHARTEDGRTVAQTVLDELAALNAGADPLGSIGAVVGATIGATGHDLSAVNGPFLAPGIGAQGATAADLRTVFGSALSAVLPSTSREVLRHGPDPVALRAAADRALAACQSVLTTV
ncbi:MAG: orotidine 5-phosphate decarboxylase [Actinomycetia bacterium]|jgi:orotidine-5'-phosphate decarboxylase|nr:orotidine 5-phosphate decarboxylase [Actinomycetes bacterium]MDQ1652735.1 orotidine-5-phosphate decarboxylase [Cryptosporangiaceae bacterium]MDQ1655012.1 orotidine-5-phosphate decarboxylase [Cryptosporangiaceae bacterium]